MGERYKCYMFDQLVLLVEYKVVGLLFQAFDCKEGCCANNLSNSGRL